MTLLSLLGDGQPAFAIGTGAKTGSLGVSFALPAKGEKKGASAPRKARASSGVAVPDKPLGLVSSPATPHSNCRSTPNTSSCPLPALSTLHLCGEMEGEVTHHRCVCDLGARSSPAGSQDIAACSPSRGGCAQSRHPHTSTKSPLCTNGCQKNKKPGNGANRGSGSGAQPCLGLPGSPPRPPAPRPPPRPAGSEPPLAAARGMPGPSLCFRGAPGSLRGPGDARDGSPVIERPPLARGAHELLSARGWKAVLGKSSVLAVFPYPLLSCC